VRENKLVRHNFVVELKDLIVVPNIAERLRMLECMALN